MLRVCLFAKDTGSKTYLYDRANDTEERTRYRADVQFDLQYL
jgi:hypothetical protein